MWSSDSGPSRPSWVTTGPWTVTRPLRFSSTWSAVMSLNPTKTFGGWKMRAASRRGSSRTAP